MEVVNVVAAIIIRDNKILSLKRNHGSFKNKWEFPGGKVEAGEKKTDALHREIMEELVIQIKIIEHFDHIEYEYHDFHLSMDCYICVIDKGELTLKEHKNARWLGYDKLDSVEWLPADLSIIGKLKLFLR